MAVPGHSGAGQSGYGTDHYRAVGVRPGVECGQYLDQFVIAAHAAAVE